MKYIPENVWSELRDDFRVRNNYSGRGMFGETCAAISISREGLVSLGVVLHQLMGDDAIPLAKSERSDALGHDTIVYFPGWQCENWVEQETHEEEDE